MKFEMKAKHYALVFSLILLGTSLFIDSIGLIQGAALNTLFVITTTLILLVFDVFPVPITCLLAIVFSVIFGSTDNISSAFSGYSNHILFFILASFGISAALSKTAWTKYMLIGIIKNSKGTSKALLFSMMICNAVLSAFISNVAAVLVFIPIVLEYLECYENKDDVIKTKRSFMIGLLLSAMIGGMMTPAGSSINLLTLNVLEEFTGQTIPFIKWMAIGVPTTAAILLLAFFMLQLVFPPVSISKDIILSFANSIKPTRISKRDIYTLVVVCGAILAWIISSWIPSIHITIVAIIAFTLLFIPDMNILTWKEFNQTASWETIFICGTMISLANRAVESGLSAKILELLFPAEIQLSFGVIVGLIALITFIFMIIIPSAPAAISILGPFVATFAIQNGYDPVMLTVICGLCVENCYLLPLDAPAMVTYSQNAFHMFDLPKVTAALQVAIVILMATVFPLLYNLVF